VHLVVKRRDVSHSVWPVFPGVVFLRRCKYILQLRIGRPDVLELCVLNVMKQWPITPRCLSLGREVGRHDVSMASCE
jgi:hypothetical protein